MREDKVDLNPSNGQTSKEETKTYNLEGLFDSHSIGSFTYTLKSPELPKDSPCSYQYEILTQSFDSNGNVIKELNGKSK